MANTQDFTAIFKDMMGSFPVDTKNMEEMFKNQSALAEKLSAANLEAAQKSTELSAKWAQDTLVKFGEVTRAKSEPADYAKAMSDFASSSAEAASEHMAAFAEIAKKLQTETLELMLSAGKDMSDDMTAAAKKAGADAQAATRKASSQTAQAASK
ncbi:MAG: phasin family protein [Limimaricola soesokkakensis]|uniref:phasin family protein n=1 Tax=Limimaricola soesokkakensis TaxID=1343159 RepID=UPI004059945F